MPTDEDIKNFVDDYESGMNTNAIAEKHGVNRSTAHKYLKQAGKDVCQKVPTHKDIEKFIEGYESGMSARAIAKKRGFSHRTVLKYLQETGVDTSYYTFDYGRIYCIYLDNVPWYIGQTQFSAEKRLSQHLLIGTVANRIAKDRISKDRLTVSVIEDNIPVKKLNKTEKANIKEYAKKHALINDRHNR